MIYLIKISRNFETFWSQELIFSSIFFVLIAELFIATSIKLIQFSLFLILSFQSGLLSSFYFYILSNHFFFPAMKNHKTQSILY